MFDVSTSKGYDAGKMKFVRKSTNRFEFVGRTKDNYGVQGFVEKLNVQPNDAGTISVSQVGAVHAQIRKNKWYSSQNIFVLSPNYKELINLLVVAAIDKILVNYGGYSSYPTLQTLKEHKIQLPTKDGKIDFEFMDACIRELEEERIRELSAYLTVSGLDNYELSSEEKEALDAYDSMVFGEHKFKDIFNKIRIGDLFEIKPTKAYKLTNEDLFEKNGLYPVVTNSSVNNGITGYTNLSPTEKGNMITYSDTTTSDGIFYQPTDYIGYSHIQGLYPLVHKEKWEHKSLMYTVTCFRKSASGRFDYGNKFNRNIAKEMFIQLPTKDGKINFEFMELLISAVQKLVIKDVVLYADEKIQSTKKIVKES